MTVPIYKRETSSGSQTLAGRIYLVERDTMPLKIVGLGPYDRHVVLQSSDSCVNVNVVKANDRFAEQRLKISASCVPHRVARLSSQAYNRAGRLEDYPDMAALTVEVLPRITLDSLSASLTEEQKAIMLLLIAESIAPGAAAYNEEEVQQAMRWMRHVLENRLKFPDPHVFYISEKNLLGVIKASQNKSAGEQFNGFNNYPTISTGVQKTINDILNAANTSSNDKLLKFRAHLYHARDMAAGTIPMGSDPCPTKLYFWKTAGSKSPNEKTAVRYQRYGGQDFYTLNEKFMSNYLKK